MKYTKHKFLRGSLALTLLAAMFLIGLPIETKAASPGALDSSFDVDGFAITNVAGADIGRGGAIQADGKIVIVGQSNLGGGGAALDFAVVRYNADGSLDTTFDTDGKATTDFGGIDDANSVAFQTDGKIVVAGTTTAVGGTSDFAIARYNVNGSPDTTFDTDGEVTTDFATFNDFASGVVIQADGKIVAVGVARPTASNQDNAAVRYNTNGGLDTTFDTDGKVTVSTTNADLILNVALQTDQKIVMVGGFSSGTQDFKTFRLTTNGSVDTTFNGTGSVTTNLGGADFAHAAAIQPDGKIVVGGRVSSDSGFVRYNANGTLDTTFDFDGILIVNVTSANGGNDRVSDIELQPDGKIVSAINLSSGGNTSAALRLDSNGSRDTGFGIDGVATVNLGTNSLSSAIEIQTDGKIILFGETGGGSGGDFAVARLSINIQPSASGDADGDGFADARVFRPSTGNWFTLNSGSNTVSIDTWGLAGDIPIDGDFDGDGRADLAIYRPSQGAWFISRSSNGTVISLSFGTGADKPVAADYDKDGKTDIAVWRPSNGNYFVNRSSDNFVSFFSFPFGQTGDIPVQGGAQ